MVHGVYANSECDNCGARSVVYGMGDCEDVVAYCKKCLVGMKRGYVVHVKNGNIQDKIVEDYISAKELFKERMRKLSQQKPT